MYTLNDYIAIITVQHIATYSRHYYIATNVPGKLYSALAVGLCHALSLSISCFCNTKIHVHMYQCN